MNKVALIVGGGQTLGKFLSKGLASEGYKVIIADLNSENANNVANEINTEAKNVIAIGLKVDATNEDDVINMVKDSISKFGRIDLMVYSAGIAVSHKITEFPLKDWELSFKVNTTGYFLCAKEVAKVMIKQKSGSIIQINSKSGKVGSKYNSGYSASKFAGVGLTQSIALDLAEYGVRINSLMLGNLLKSPMFQSLIPQYAKKLNLKENEVEQFYIDKVPLKRGCEYKDVLNAIIFYASEKASYMTGQSINITGGQVMF